MDINDFAAAETITVWRPAPSRAKHPICTLQRWLSNGVQDGWWFKGVGHAHHLTDEAVSDLLDRHVRLGNRVV